MLPESTAVPDGQVIPDVDGGGETEMLNGLATGFGVSTTRLPVDLFAKPLNVQDLEQLKAILDHAGNATKSLESRVMHLKTGQHLGAQLYRLEVLLHRLVVVNGRSDTTHHPLDNLVTVVAAVGQNDRDHNPPVLQRGRDLLGAVGSAPQSNSGNTNSNLDRGLAPRPEITVKPPPNGDPVRHLRLLGLEARIRRPVLPIRGGVLEFVLNYNL